MLRTCMFITYCLHASLNIRNIHTSLSIRMHAYAHVYMYVQMYMPPVLYTRSPPFKHVRRVVSHMHIYVRSVHIVYCTAMNERACMHACVRTFSLVVLFFSFFLTASKVALRQCHPCIYVHVCTHNVHAVCTQGVAETLQQQQQLELATRRCVA